ncbi:MAG: extracellular solute-binding protein [Planctomycetes bacterium]|nr:extracellular solute-binding protein [Planctomycetota bacterium]
MAPCRCRYGLDRRTPDPAGERPCLLPWFEDDHWIDPLLERFGERHPGIRVKQLPASQEEETLRTLIAAGDPPDVSAFSHEALDTYRGAGALEPLDAHLAGTDFDAGAYFPKSLEALRRGAALYGLPKDCTPYVFFHDVGAFEDAGWRSLGVRRAPRGGGARVRRRAARRRVAPAVRAAGRARVAALPVRRGHDRDGGAAGALDRAGSARPAPGSSLRRAAAAPRTGRQSRHGARDDGVLHLVAEPAQGRRGHPVALPGGRGGRALRGRVRPRRAGDPRGRRRDPRAGRGEHAAARA